MPKKKTPSVDTPIDDVLPISITRLLKRNGLHTVEAVRNASAKDLFKLKGVGIVRFRQIEQALNVDFRYLPKYVPPAAPRVADSQLNGVLPIAVVRALARGGIKTRQELVEAYPEKLSRIRSLGPATLREIEQVFFSGLLPDNLDGDAGARTES